MGAKRRLNGTSKVNRHTDTQTDTHTWTNRPIESIGPEGRCFENMGPRRKQKNQIHPQIEKSDTFLAVP